MEESSPPPTTTGVTKRRPEISVMSHIGKVCLSVAASLQEGFGYFKAFLVGQAKKMRARSEKEASEADLQTAKMEVEVADAAEDTKKRLDKTY